MNHCLPRTLVDCKAITVSFRSDLFSCQKSFDVRIVVSNLLTLAAVCLPVMMYLVPARSRFSNQCGNPSVGVWAISVAAMRLNLDLFIQPHQYVSTWLVQYIFTTFRNRQSDKNHGVKVQSILTDE